MEIYFQGFEKRLQWKFLSKVLKIQWKSLSKVLKMFYAQTGPTWRVNLFTGVFGKQIPTGFDYNKKDQTRDP